MKQGCKTKRVFVFFKDLFERVNEHTQAGGEGERISSRVPAEWQSLPWA